MLWLTFGMGVVFTLVLLFFILHMLQDSGLIRSNYCGEQIPLCMGIVFVLGSTVANGLILLLKEIFLWYGRYPSWHGRVIPIDSKAGLLLMIAVITMGLLGLIDDLLGTRAASGLKGHFVMLLRKRKLTTGALKALMGGFVALLFSSFYSDCIIIWVMNALILALSTNALNLLDLRPGRAMKFYILIMVMIFGVGLGRAELLFLAPIIGSVLVCFPFDLRARAMMGDVGSNVLGISMGIGVIWTFSTWLRFIFLILLIIFHIFTELYSLSEIIANNKFLSKIDQIGRRK